MAKDHVHKWMVIYEGSSEKENVEILAICMADAEASKNFINAGQLLKGELPDVCSAKLTRKEIEERLNQSEVRTNSPGTWKQKPDLYKDRKNEK